MVLAGLAPLLVVAAPRPAGAVELRCVSGAEAKARALKLLAQNAKTYYGVEAAALDAAQARFILELDSRLNRCSISLGKAQLGGKPGTLLSSTWLPVIDAGPARMTIFCTEPGLSQCQIRALTATPTQPAGAAAPGAEPGAAWEPAAIVSEPIAKNFFAYSVTATKDGRVLATFFAPDIIPYVP